MMKSTIPSRIWETKRVLITKLYEEEEWPLKQVIKALQSKDFHPSETQLRSRLKKWHVTKPSRKKLSTSKGSTCEAKTAPERCGSQHEVPLSTEIAMHNSLCPGSTSASPLQGLLVPASSESPCFPAAGSSVQPFGYTHTIPESGYVFATSRPSLSDRRFSSQSTPDSSGTENEPGGSLYRWPTCFDPAGLGVATSVIDPLLSSSTHAPVIPSPMEYSQSGTELEPNLATQPRLSVGLLRTDVKPSPYPRELQSERNIAPAAFLNSRENERVRIYGTETNFALEGVEGYPAWIGPYDAYTVAYPAPKVLQPPLWPLGSNVVSDGLRY
ncbi:Clr5 domain-containing protein [Aspergillus affinis]|uniref:Clr5 domain-containing protein n=1 Tax=Aspergillus affinis TaxID=1070780 RepID=UPI0022FE521C|nr:uncharacterized protein KD926_009553 [Aspergillus affinis]KAI9045139.1 hypothetical protein KD926_009553 [Aspergillus affinis]